MKQAVFGDVTDGKIVNVEVLEGINKLVAK